MLCAHAPERHCSFTLPGLWSCGTGEQSAFLSGYCPHNDVGNIAWTHPAGSSPRQNGDADDNKANAAAVTEHLSSSTAVSVAVQTDMHLLHKGIDHSSFPPSDQAQMDAADSPASATQQALPQTHAKKQQHKRESSAVAQLPQHESSAAAQLPRHDSSATAQLPRHDSSPAVQLPVLPDVPSAPMALALPEQARVTQTSSPAGSSGDLDSPTSSASVNAAHAKTSSLSRAHSSSSTSSDASVKSTHAGISPRHDHNSQCSDSSHAAAKPDRTASSARNGFAAEPGNADMSATSAVAKDADHLSKHSRDSISRGDRIISNRHENSDAAEVNQEVVKAEGYAMADEGSRRGVRQQGQGRAGGKGPRGLQLPQKLSIGTLAKHAGVDKAFMQVTLLLFHCFCLQLAGSFNLPTNTLIMIVMEKSSTLH